MIGGRPSRSLTSANDAVIDERSAKGKVLIHWSLHSQSLILPLCLPGCSCPLNSISLLPTPLAPHTWNANTPHTCHELMPVDSMCPSQSIFALGKFSYLKYSSSQPD